MTQEKQQVSVSELEAEFGMTGNTDAGESDAVADVAAEKVDVADLDGETVHKDGIPTREVEDEIQAEIAMEGLDDNVEIMERELGGQEESGEEVGSEEEGEEGEGGDGEGDEENEGAEAGEGADEDEGEGGEGEEDAGEGDSEEGEEGEEGGEGDAGDLTPMMSWVRKNIQDEATRQELFDVLAEEGAMVTYRANGETITEPLSAVTTKAAGYAGEEVVTQRAKAAKAAMEAAQEKEQAAVTAKEHAEAMLRGFEENLDDPEWMSSFLTSTAPVEYLRAIHRNIADALDEAEANPGQFQMKRNLAGIERKLDEILSGKGGQGSRETADGRETGGHDDGPEDASGEPATIPDNWGFIRGQGYPKAHSGAALRELDVFLDAAGAAGVDLKYQDVLESWKGEGRTRPILDVAKGLVAGKRRDSQKLTISGKPPVKRAPAGRKVGGKKPRSDRRSGAQQVEWDSIPERVAAELDAAANASEL